MEPLEISVPRSAIGSSRDAPIRALFLAIYERAVLDLNDRNQRVRQEAAAWLNGEARAGGISLADVKSAAEELPSSCRRVANPGDSVAPIFTGTVDASSTELCVEGYDDADVSG